MSYARPLSGVKVAVSPFVVTKPVTSPLSLRSLKDSIFRVEPFISKEKVAETAVLVPTPVAPLDGLVEVTVRVTLGGGSPPPELGATREAVYEPIAYPSPLPPVYWAKSIRPHTKLVTTDTVNTVMILYFISDPP